MALTAWLVAFGAFIQQVYPAHSERKAIIAISQLNLNSGGVAIGSK